MVEVYIEEAKLIGPGTKEICRAAAKLRCKNEKGGLSSQWIEAKLDSCGSVSLSHSKFLTEIKPCKDYKLPAVTYEEKSTPSGAKEIVPRIYDVC